MTESEAIEVIEKNRPTTGYTMLNEALGIAIEALEKQIPKKPYWRIEEDAKGYACPICNMGVTIDHGRIRETFCSNCGQRIDFGE